MFSTQKVSRLMCSHAGECGGIKRNHFSNSELVEVKTIEALFDDDTVDTVHVHFVDEDMDQMCDCHEPVEMINLEIIMRKKGVLVS